MSTRAFSRRQFLARAATGAGAVAGAGALGAGCSASSPGVQPHAHAVLASTVTEAGATNDHFVFFTTMQGRTVDAIAERMIQQPLEDLGGLSPTATALGVLTDLARRTGAAREEQSARDGFRCAAPAAAEPLGAAGYHLALAEWFPGDAG